MSDVDLGIMLPALLAGALVLATHVPLGQQVLARGIIFIDLAVAQIAGLGVILAALAGWETGGWRAQIAATISAVAGALLLNWSERRWPDIQEALIGVAFVLAASGSLLILASDPHGAEQLKDLLSGQILWVGYDQLIPAAIVFALVLAFWYGLGQPPGTARFYLLFAFAVTVSVQLVGVYLVFASLIVPALATRHYAPRYRLVAGYLVGLIGYTTGLLISALYDTPASPTIVWTLTSAALLMGTFRLRRRTA